MEEQKNEVPSVPESEMKMPEGAEAAEESSSTAPIIIGVLVVVFVVIVAGLYLWGSMLRTNPEGPSPLPRTPAASEPATESEETDAPTAGEAPAEDATVTELETVSNSDEIEAIEADLEATDLDTLDSELDAIDAELEEALNAI